MVQVMQKRVETKKWCRCRCRVVQQYRPSRTSHTHVKVNKSPEVNEAINEYKARILSRLFGMFTIMMRRLTEHKRRTINSHWYR